MKRTRRVEIVRYSRRSTVISNELALDPDLTAEQAAIDVLLGIPCMTESTVEETSGAEGQAAAPYQQTDQKPDSGVPSRAARLGWGGKGGQAGAGTPGIVQERRPWRFLKRSIRA